MGVRHVVMFRWREGVDADHPARTSAALATLPGQIPEIREYRFGPNLGINPGTYDFVVVADFDDEAAYLVYRDHPAHQQVIADVITGFVAERAAAQYATGTGPT